MTEDEIDELHLQAYRALLGTVPLAALVELLRSDAPLHPLIRRHLADALDPAAPTPGAIKLVAKRRRGTPIDWAERRAKAYRMGPAIDLLSKLLAEGVKEEAAVHDVHQKFGFAKSEIRAWKTNAKKAGGGFPEKLPRK